MGITVQWDNPEKTIIYAHFEQPWTWTDFEAHVDQIRNLAAGKRHAVHAIIDVRESAVLPAGAITKFRQTMATLSTILSSLTLVGGTLLDESLTVAAQRATRPAHRMELRFVATLEEARALSKQSA